MKWEEDTLCIKDRFKYNLTVYNGSYIVGSIIYKKNDGWYSIIDDSEEFMDAKTLKEAKKEFKNKLYGYCESQINFCEEITRKLDELEGGNNGNPRRY